MKDLIINGEKRDQAFDEKQLFSEFLKTVKQQITGGELISQIIVDGQEIGIRREDELSGVPLSKIESLEIKTEPPRVLAAQTLLHLKEFAVQLTTICSGMKQARNWEAQFLKVVEGVQTMAETVSTVRRVVAIKTVEPIDILETELVNILRSIVDAKQRGQREVVDDLLATEFCDNLNQWIQMGIPALIQAANKRES